MMRVGGTGLVLNPQVLDEELHRLPCPRFSLCHFIFFFNNMCHQRSFFMLVEDYPYLSVLYEDW